jgi:two-component system OmpR family sensor kinase
MASLRARLLAGVLALTAVGLLLLGSITYAEQRSFLYKRVDQQAQTAPSAVAHDLQEGGGGPDDYGPRGPRGGHDYGPPPGGTYGQLRDPSGAVVAEGPVFGPSDSTGRPHLPDKIQTDKLFTVGGTDTRYRVYADRDPVSGYVSVVAVPLREVDQALNRLLLVTGLVIAGVLLALGLAAWAIVRVGLLPLDRMGHTAGAIAGGDLSHRVESTDPRTEVGRLGISLNAMLDRLESAFAQREASEDLVIGLLSFWYIVLV